ncbi:enoyl-CoA hydratase-related protein [Anaeromyxobacter dehalogenans]|uniref:Enoyl-CoA hydratase/isomerase n=2 Tax=Anaeromyxobacter TaxID=161492 RepID=Q2IFZ7_ANADE|nr:enoyl-CoA hydratase-related protein [Anaeromyxobacter dehalogenans]ABC83508.1 Enoyl-CoA hydratase/isomerase [Anaeromyxobacter dehalogenans 2CP-C]
MTGRRVRTEDRGLVRVLVVDNVAKRNALDFRALDELEEACGAAARDRVRCLLLRGAGEDAFSSGFDLAEMGRTSRAGLRPDEAVERAADALSAVPCPTVAFLNGSAFGGGLELAATCDLRVAREGALLGLPPAKLGVVYPEGGIGRFLGLVGAARTRELFLVGRPVDAATALAWGLVNRLAPAAGAEAVALALADEIAGNAPLAVQGMKRILQLLEGTHERGLSEREREEIAGLRRRAFESADMREARQARAERRPPRFRGE